LRNFAQELRQLEHYRTQARGIIPCSSGAPAFASSLTDQPARHKEASMIKLVLAKKTAASAGADRRRWPWQDELAPVSHPDN
jgi:hypothetical protein